MKTRFSLILALWLSGNVLYALPYTNIDSLAEIIACKLIALDGLNRDYRANKQFDQTSYVVNYTPSPDTPLNEEKVWAKETGFTERRILTAIEIDSLDAKLKRFNNARNDQIRVYVLLVNNYQLMLRSQINLDTIQQYNLKNIKSKIAENQEAEFNRFLTDQKELVAKVAAKVGQDNSTQDLALYYFEKSRLYQQGDKQKWYWADQLLLQGVLKNNDRDIRAEVHTNNSTGTNSQRVIRAVENLMNAIEMVIDYGIHQPEINCNKTYAQMAVETMRARKFKWDNAVDECALLLSNLPQQNRVGNSQFFISDNLELLDTKYWNKILPDKLEALTIGSKTCPFQLQFVFCQVDFIIGDDSLDVFANDVKSKLTGYNPWNPVYVIVPYIITTCTASDWYYLRGTTYQGLIMPCVWAPQNFAATADIKAALRGPGTFEDKMNMVYRKVPKYHETQLFIINYSGEIAVRPITVSPVPVQGFDWVIDVNVECDSRFTQLCEKRIDYNSKLKARNVIESEIIRIRGEIDALQSSETTFKPLQLDIKQLSLIARKTEGGREVIKYVYEYALWFVDYHKAGNLFEMFTAISSPPDDIFYAGMNPEMYQQHLHTIDAIGVMLGFVGLDIVTDGIGFLYASYYDDTQNKMIYGACALIPVTSSALLRGLLKGEMCIVRQGGQFVIQPSTARTNALRAGGNVALLARYPGLRNALPAVEARIGGQAYNTVETSLRSMSDEALEVLESNADLIDDWADEILLNPNRSKAKPDVENWVTQRRAFHAATDYLSWLNNFPTLRSRIQQLGNTQRSAFKANFNGNTAGLQQLETELAVGNDLVETWLGISHLHSVKNNVSFLKELKFAQNSHLPVHLMGEINSANRAVGCHYLGAVDGIRVRWDQTYPGTNPFVQNGITQGKIQILKTGGDPLNPSDWISKNAFSSFFPSTWSPSRIIEEIAFVKVNPANKLGANNYVYRGKASDGNTYIRVKMTGQQGNYYDTAYPD
jgi:Bacterial EndoU nuclease